MIFFRFLGFFLLFSTGALLSFTGPLPAFAGPFKKVELVAEKPETLFLSWELKRKNSARFIEIRKRSKDEGLPPSHKSDQKFFDGGNPFFSLPSFFTGCSCACTQDCLRSPSSFALHFSLIFFQMHFSQKISLVIFFLFAGGLCNSLGRANRVSQAGP